MLRFMSLSSGSCGNCYYLESQEGAEQRHAVLIDAGVSLRRLKTILSANGLDENSFSAVLVTHDHMDHIRSLASYCKKLKKPVYATPELHAALSAHAFGSPFWVNAGKNLSRVNGMILPVSVSSISSFLTMRLRLWDTIFRHLNISS